MAELEYALLAEFARLDDEGSLTVVGGHRSIFAVVGTPSQHVVCVAGRLLVARREPPALLGLGAVTPEGEVPVVAQWPVEPRPGALVDGRLAVCFAVSVVAPLPVAGDYALTLSVNGELARRLPFTVVDAPSHLPR